MAENTLLRFLKKLKPYTIQKGLRYLKHYGLKGFLVRLRERMEPEEVPYGPWREQYCATEGTWRVRKIINFLIVRRSALLFRLTVRRKFFCVR